VDDPTSTQVADARSVIPPAVDNRSAPAASSGRTPAGDSTETEARVRALFHSELELEVEVDTDLIESGLLDSMAFVQLLVELEQEFGITVDMGALDLEDFRSVRGIAGYVELARAET
jgi:acyl carrier protein